MAVGFYFDVHIPAAIRDQLRLKGVDVLTAQEDAADRLTDEDLLGRALTLSRLMFTYDMGFKMMAEDWQRQSKLFAGLLFGRDSPALVGKYVQDLELIAHATDLSDWMNFIQHLPYK
jgi:hypothetical protein